MNKTYISASKLACLGLVCMISCIDYTFNALIVSVAAAAAFILAIAIVSNLEKITNSHVRFIIYAIIVSGILTILKLVFGYVGSLKFIDVAADLDYGLLAALVLGIYPIYYLHRTTSKTYYLSTLITAMVFVLFAIIVGSVLEILAHGSFLGMFYFRYSFDVVSIGFIAFTLISILCVVSNSIEMFVTEKRRAERLLIDKYKYMIRENQLEKLKKQNEEVASQVFEVGGQDNEH